jgi:uncharacterized tellurite resistance protein B-like protein
MGLFDKMFATTAQVELLNDQEAMMALVYCAMSADGSVDDEEIENLAIVLAQRRLFQGMILRDTYFKVAKMHTSMGGQALVTAAAQKLSDQYKASAFTLAIDLMLADGTVGMQEKTLLEHMQIELGLSDEVVTKIVEVIILKNNI